MFIILLLTNAKIFHCYDNLLPSTSYLHLFVTSFPPPA